MDGAKQEPTGGASRMSIGCGMVMHISEEESTSGCRRVR